MYSCELEHDIANAGFSEVNHFRDTMNSRLEYYKALQKLSDQVAPIREETIGQPLDQRVYQSAITEEARLQQKIVLISAKLRYLVHMKTESKSTTPRVCVICTDEFEVGSMTAVSSPRSCCLRLAWLFIGMPLSCRAYQGTKH
jgi:E3 ubiquitin-protein ligase SHPRH